MFTTHDWLSEPMPKLKPTYAAISWKYAAKEKRIGDPTQLILADGADRLKMTSLEQMRAIFDAGGIGLVLTNWNAGLQHWVPRSKTNVLRGLDRGNRR
jgi:DNA transposition AAA+ family ATPase